MLFGTFTPTVDQFSLFLFTSNFPSYFNRNFLKPKL
eukprot:UN12106